MEYKFEYGTGAIDEYEITFSEQELTIILLQDKYEMTIHMHVEHEWLHVELCPKTDDENKKGVYSMKVDGAKEAYDFIAKFVETKNVKIASDFEHSGSKRLSFAKYFFHENILETMQSEIEGVKILNVQNPVKATKTNEKTKKKKVEVDDDCPY